MHNVNSININSIKDQIIQSCYHWGEEVGSSVQSFARDQIQRTQTSIANTSQSIHQKCLETNEKVKKYIHENRNTIFFIGCSCATAYFAPTFFFATAIVTIILRVELSSELKYYANEYLKDDHNPYKLKPSYGPHYISSIDITLGSIAAIDAIALGTIFLPASLSVTLIPALGGIAAGNTIAKWGLDIANSWHA